MFINRQHIYKSKQIFLFFIELLVFPFSHL